MTFFPGIFPGLVPGSDSGRQRGVTRGSLRPLTVTVGNQMLFDRTARIKQQTHQAVINIMCVSHNYA
jgi:hypothetical protein